MCSTIRVDIWLFTSELWLTAMAMANTSPHEIRAIRADPTIVSDFAPYLVRGLQDSSARAPMRHCCSAAKSHAGALGADATAVRSQKLYLDITPPGLPTRQLRADDRQTSGHFDRCGRHIATWQNDLAMFKNTASRSRWQRHGRCQKTGDTCGRRPNENEGFAGRLILF